jgi:hypothetical protein
MNSRSEQGNEQNGPFEPASRPSQIVKPGIELVQRGKEAEEPGVVRLTPADPKEIPQMSLAERIHEQEERK